MKQPRQSNILIILVATTGNYFHVLFILVHMETNMKRDACFLDLGTLFLDLYMFFGPNRNLTAVGVFRRPPRPELFRLQGTVRERDWTTQAPGYSQATSSRAYVLGAVVGVLSPAAARRYGQEGKQAMVTTGWVEKAELPLARPRPLGRTP